MNRVLCTSVIAALVGLGPGLAYGRKGPHELRPMVRHKYELRLNRFEVAPTFEATVGADYKHTLSAGLKAEYHLSDNLSFGGLLFFGGGLDTALAEEIRDSLPNDEDPPQVDPTPSRNTFDEHLNQMPIHGGVHATFTPWFGKMALFGKSFLSFDMYLSGGFGFAQTTNGLDEDFCAPTNEVDAAGNKVYSDPRNDCAYNSGFNPGLQFGAGMHVFFNRWIALDLSFRDYMFMDNPSGLDFDGDQKVDDEDRRFMNHLFFGVGVAMYLPTKVKISR